MPSQPRLKVLDHDSVRVIQLTERRLFDDVVVREAGEQLLAALPRTERPSVVVDLTGVETISSLMLVKFLLLQRQMDAAGGRLRLCELNPTIRSVFRTSNLDRLFAIDRDLNTAIDMLRTEDDRTTLR